MEEIEFKTLRRPFLLDGATGTELQKRGMPAGVCPERWVLEHPEALLDLQRRYVEAGSQAVYAPTFGANRAALGKYGLGERVREYNLALVKLSREAAAGRALVGGDLSPTGLAVPPVEHETFEELVDVFTEQAAALEEAGVDFFAVETQLSLAEARAAVLAVRSVSQKPVFVTFVLGPGGRSLYGGDLCGILLALMDLHIDAFGINCTGDLTLMRYTLEDLGRLTRLPLIAKPNAGQPQRLNGRNVYSMEPEELAGAVERFVAGGAVILGGCCGTDERHIAALKAAAAATEPTPRELNMGDWYSSEYEVVNYRPAAEPDEGAEDEEAPQIDEESIPYDWELNGTEVAELPVDGEFEERAQAAARNGAQLLRLHLETPEQVAAVLESQHAVRTPLWVSFADDGLKTAFLREYSGHPKLR